MVERSKACEDMQGESERGFSLLEIMVVLIIIGVMAAMVAPKFFDVGEGAKVEATRVQMKNIEQALKLYRLQYGRYPSSGEGINALVSSGKGGKSYLDSVPKDAWGGEFVYLNPGVHGDIDIMSYGADGKAGGSGFDTDVGNWE
ncbi:MAG: type II secretion system protein GspG [Zetaproteobacteria bacterium CG_4_9_14_3_um_filter_49_83]|nr:MAG: type II secretion system protein GspG [Zetaproteobacteria bacterium CG1_02_49_23]PIQ30704.1 MAG: type II secretion system protein GspG [Zetaproteobacteria bacterium CG17_big_fil_post_rev_8_21_14_2_50_50_13]PIV29176.1 MAG: type II secretion system protein GspG [Zetaproteobacteria bacterium CG02_land_8_20_14_3_00_50_9]PIY57195.1 MAG: type II secretion system protein GspG [Zetaproteobacteria bacterium CG_4_10_14_0_8_um_filter_49_80]PJA34470.1 MAG: type II secretion system protein GspG [Zet